MLSPPKKNIFIIFKLKQFIFLEVKISRFIMKDLLMINKFGVHGVLFVQNLEIFSFRWLR